MLSIRMLCYVVCSGSRAGVVGRPAAVASSAKSIS